MAADGRIEIDTKIDSKGVDKGVKEISKKLDAVGEKMKSIGEGMQKYITLPLAALGTGALKVASDFDSSQALIQSSLGITKEEAAKLNDTVQNVWKEGFGSNLEEVSKALLTVKQNMQGVAEGAELERITKDALTLAKVFESDVNEVTRAGNNIMNNFGIESDKAFDLMAYGAQNGLNFSKEMFDNISEYAPLFSDAGFSADEMFNYLIKGAQTGIYNLDYLNDAVKEFGVLAVEEGGKFEKAMASMPESTQKVFKDFREGKATIKDVMDSAIGDLNKMDDKVKVNQIGVELFGTKWEDLGADAILAMGGVSGSLDGVTGSMSGMTEVQEEAFGQRFQATLRNLLTALEPLGVVLIDMAGRLLPKLSAMVEKISNWFTNLSPAMQTAVTVFGMIISVVGVLLVPLGSLITVIGGMIPLFTKVMGVITKAGGVMNILRTVFMALTGPVGIVIGVITALIAIGVTLYKNWDSVSAFLSKCWEGLKNAGVTVFNFLKDFFSKWGLTILSVITGPIGILVGLVVRNFDSIKSGVSNAMNSVLSTIKNIWGNVTGFFKGINLSSIGKNIIQGLINGIGGMAGAITKKVKSLAKLVPDGLKDFLKIKSPSQLIRDEVGKEVPAGLAVGIDANTDLVNKSLDKMLSIPELALNPISSPALNPAANPVAIEGTSNNPINGVVEAVINIGGYQAKGLVEFITAQQSTLKNQTMRNVRVR